MARYVVVKANKVVNVVEWDGKTPWVPPDGCTATPHLMAGIGWDWNNGSPVDNRPPPPPPPPPLDLSNFDNLERALKAAILAAAILSGKTPADAKTAFKQAWSTLG